MTWATYVPILVFLGLSVLELGAMYTTDRRPTQIKASLNASTLWGQGITIMNAQKGTIFRLGQHWGTVKAPRL